MKNKKTKLIAIGLVVVFVVIFAFTMPYMAMALAPFLLWSLAGQFAGEPPKEQEDLILKTLDGLAPDDDNPAKKYMDRVRKNVANGMAGVPPYDFLYWGSSNPNDI